MRNKEIQTIIDEKIDNFIYGKYAENKKCIYSGEVYKEGKLKAGYKFYEYNFYEYKIYRKIDDVVLLFELDSSFDNVNITKIFTTIAICGVIIDGKFYKTNNDIMKSLESIYINEKQAEKLGISKDIFRKLISNYIKNLINDYPGIVVDEFKNISQKEYKYIFELYNDGYLTKDEAYVIISLPNDFQITDFDKEILEESTSEDIENIKFNKLMNFYDKYINDKNYKFSGEIIKKGKEKQPANWVYAIYKDIDDIIVYYLFESSNTYIDSIKIEIIAIDVLIDGKHYPINAAYIGMEDIYADEETAKKLGLSEKIFRELVSFGLKNQIEGGYMNTIKYINSKEKITPKQINYISKLYNLGYLTKDEAISIISNDLDAHSRIKSIPDTDVLEESVEEVDYKEVYKEHSKEIQKKLNKFHHKYKSSRKYDYLLSGEIYKIENESSDKFRVYRKIDDVILKYSFSASFFSGDIDYLEVYVSVYGVILNNGEIYISYPAMVGTLLVDEELAKRIGLSEDIFRQIISNELKSQIKANCINLFNDTLTNQQIKYLYKLYNLGYLTKDELYVIIALPNHHFQIIDYDKEVLDEGYIQGKYIKDFAPIEKIEELEKELDVIIDNIKSQGLQYILDNCRVFRKAKLYNSEIAIGNFIFECNIWQSLKDSSNIKNNYITITYDRVIYDNGKYKAVYLDRRKQVYSGYFSIDQCSKLGFTKNTYKRALAYNIVNYSVDTQCNYSLENQIFILQLYKEGYLDKNDLAYVLDHLDVYNLHLEKKDEVIEESYWYLESKFPKELEEKVINETINLKDIKRIVKEYKNEIDLFSENDNIISYKRDIESLVSAIELQLYWYSEEILLYTSIIYNDGETKTLTKVFNITIKDLLDMGLSYKKILYRLLNYYNTTEKDEDISRLIFTYYKNHLMTKDEYRTLMMLIINEMKDDIANIEYLE